MCLASDGNSEHQRHAAAPKLPQPSASISCLLDLSCTAEHVHPSPLREIRRDQVGLHHDAWFWSGPALEFANVGKTRRAGQAMAAPT